MSRLAHPHDYGLPSHRIAGIKLKQPKNIDDLLKIFVHENIKAQLVKQRSEGKEGAKRDLDAPPDWFALLVVLGRS